MKEQEYKLNLIILAAGNSRRFGSNKLLYKVDGIPMYRRSLELMKRMEKENAGIDRNAEAGTDKTFLSFWKLRGKRLRCKVMMVTQYEEIKKEAEAAGAAVLVNFHPEEGISSSMKLGLGASLDADACLFAVADQPWLKPESVRRLIRDYLASEKGIASLIYEGEPGNPCIFSKRYYPELLTLTGDRGGKRILKAHPYDVLCVRASDSDELRDFDTPPDSGENPSVPAKRVMDFCEYF